MYYIGIDPGSNYTGLAILSGDVFVYHREYIDPVLLWTEMEALIDTQTCLAAIEDMLGTGRRDKHIVRTIKVLGYLEYRFREQGRIKPEIVPQQVRLAYVSLVPKNITGKDEKSAAAHALALRERSLR